MKTLKEISRSWKTKKSTISSAELQSLNTLLLSEDESQVASSFTLLLSYGEESLCEILLSQNEIFTLNPEIIRSFHKQWERCILEEVSQKESYWYEHYSCGSFIEMHKESFFGLSFHQCSSTQQRQILKIYGKIIT